MNSLATCSQGHVWPAETDGPAETAPVCPVCGRDGRAIAVQQQPTIVAASLAHDQIPSFVAEVTGHIAAPGVPQVDGYEILRELGRGGMGVVYLAMHLELKRLVALKMMLAGPHADPELKLRFRREAEAVARLQHPGIVQIYDVGEARGFPYLALEYIEGLNLASFLARAPIPARHAAEIVESLARTIHYAHQNGIVHRDLTPRNILIPRNRSDSGSSPAGGEPAEPRITDFGLARDLENDSGQTLTGVVLGTPSYMSPEQADGRSSLIGPATDIFSLGAIFYETLTGRPPFLGENRHVTIRQVVEHDPIPPRQLQPGVPRDAETICLKCLAKDAVKRYGTAAELAEDLRRFLSFEPVRARPISAAGRTVRWVRRRPTLAALLMVVTLAALMMFAGALLYNARVRGERDRAENSLRLALRAVDEMLTEVGERQLATEPRMEIIRRNLLSRALNLHREFLNQNRTDTRVRFETAASYRRLADIYRLLEQQQQALDAYADAIRLLEEPDSGRPESQSRDVRLQLADCYNFRGEVLRAATRHAEAEMSYTRAQLLLDQLVAQFPDMPDYAEDQARTLYNQGLLYQETQRPAQAEQALRNAVQVLRDLVRQDAAEPTHRQHLARALLNLGTVIRNSERASEAENACHEAIDLLTPLSREFPDVPDYHHELGVCCNNLGNLCAQSGRLTEALTAHDRSRRQFLSLVTSFPRILVYQQELANTLNSIGNVHADRNDLNAARRSWQEAERILRTLVNDKGDILAYHADLAMVLGNLGLACHADSDLSGARQYLEQAADHLRQCSAAGMQNPFLEQMLRDRYQNLAEVLVGAGDHAAAADAADNLAAIKPESAVSAYYAACFLARCADLPLRDAESGPSPSPADELAAAYRNRSVALLQLAINRGFRDAAQLERDCGERLRSIATRPELLELLELLRRQPATTGQPQAARFPCRGWGSGRLAEFRPRAGPNRLPGPSGVHGAAWRRES